MSPSASGVLLDDLPQVGADLGKGDPLDLHRAVLVLSDDDVEPPCFGVLLRIVLAEMRPATLLPLEGRPGDRLRDGEKVREVQRRVPAGVVTAVPLDADLFRAIDQRADGAEGLPHLLLSPADPDPVLHQVLKVLLHLVRSLPAGSLERREGEPREGVDPGFVDLAATVLLRELRGVLAGALPEDQ